MITRSFPSLWMQRCLHAAVLLSLLLSPLQSIAAYSPPPAQDAISDLRLQISDVAVGEFHSSPRWTESAGGRTGLPSTGLYRTTVTLRTPADWARLEELGAVVLERTAQEITADRQENADQERARTAASRESAVLVDEDQLEALARLRFEPRATDELSALVMAHAGAKPWLVAGVRAVLVGQQDGPELADQGAGAVDQSVNSGHPVLTPELKAALATLTSVNADAGLTRGSM